VRRGPCAQQIVHHDDVADTKIGHQFVFDKGTKHIVARPGVDGHEASESVQGECAEHRHVDPVSMNGSANRIVTAWSSSVSKWQTEAKARFIVGRGQTGSVGSNLRSNFSDLADRKSV